MGMLDDTNFVTREVADTGNTCTVTEVSKSFGSDEYRAVTETTTDNTSINCWVQILDESDEIVKQGNAKAGDAIFWFDNDNESILANGNRITFDSKSYEITDTRKFDVAGGTTHLIECRTSQQ